MKICIIHGYKLDGTGSNIYVRNIANELVSRGHDLSIMCQDRNADVIDFVDELFFLDRNNESLLLKAKKKTGFKGSCRVFIPDLNGKLLVYVYDRYDDFPEVLTFQEAEKEKILDYTDRNIKALMTIIKAFPPDIIHTNHAIMQPYIARRALLDKKIPCIATVHGSALNFSVRKSEFLHSFASEGLGNSKIVICVSEYNARELVQYFISKGDKLEKKIKVLPVGIDINKFNIYGFKDDSDKKNNILKLMGLLREKIKLKDKGLDTGSKKALNAYLDSISGIVPDESLITEYFNAHYSSYDAYSPDKDIKDVLSSIDFIKKDIILFTGKYLWTKGCQTLITALPYIFKRSADTEVIFIGFGQSRAVFESLVYCLSKGYKDLFLFLAQRHFKIDPGSKADTPEITKKFLERLEKQDILNDFFLMAKELDFYNKVHFTGIMSHDELRYMMPLADVFVAPSIFTEAFGTVAAEALACGVLPVITYDYGFKEVRDNIYKKLDEESLHKLPLLRLNEDFIDNLAKNIISILDFPKRKDSDFRSKCHNIASSFYSWTGIAAEYENLYRYYLSNNF
ncbi:MAG: glycosyltransferase family 4 protein [Actinobacteria bacterium]|nr:glycosyltransferase family 4 protein [Actinomycetota bacterium]